MINFFKSVIIRIKTLINFSYLFSILFIPIGLFLMMSNLNLEKDLKIRIGFVFESESAKEHLKTNLEKSFGEGIDVLIFEDKEELKKQVESYKIDCGYVFTNEFEKDYKKSILVFETDSTIASNIVNTLVASVAMQERSGELGYNVIKNFLLNKSKDEIVKTITLESYEFTKNGPLMKIEYGDIKGNFENKIIPSPINLDKIFYGLFASVAIWISLINSQTIIKEKNSEIFSRIKLSTNINYYYITFFVSMFILNLIYLILSHTILSTVYMVEFKFINIFISDILFSLFISFISLLFAKFFVNNKFLTSITIFIFLFTFIFSESIFKISEIASSISFLKFFSPVYYYIKFLS